MKKHCKRTTITAWILSLVLVLSLSVQGLYAGELTEEAFLFSDELASESILEDAGIEEPETAFIETLSGEAQEPYEEPAPPSEGESLSLDEAVNLEQEEIDGLPASVEISVPSEGEELSAPEISEAPQESETLPVILLDAETVSEEISVPDTEPVLILQSPEQETSELPVISEAGTEAAVPSPEAAVVTEVMPSDADEVIFAEVSPQEVQFNSDVQVPVLLTPETDAQETIVFPEEIPDPQGESPEETGTLTEMEIMPEPEGAGTDMDLSTAMVSLSSSFIPTDLQPVRDQYSTGLCWAFTTAASMEIWLARHGEGTYDLSEEHLAYFSVNRVNDPLGNTAGDRNSLSPNGHTYAFRNGGNQLMASLFLSTWSGFDLESRAPLGVDSLGNEVAPTLQESQAYETAAYLTDAVFSSSNSPARYKQLISDYGSVGVSLYMDKALLYTDPGSGDVTYNLPKETSSVNHAVTLVGWDDNYPKERFSSSSGVTSNGAFLARNSWGVNEYGNGGYFYISYECQMLKNGVSVTGTTNPRWKNNYFYDGTSSLLEYEPLLPASNVSGTTAVANIFHVTAGNGLAEALGQVVVADYKDGGSYGIQVYTNLTNLSDPTSGNPAFASPVSYKKTYAGIGTCTLPSEVLLTQDSWFSVVITSSGSGEAKILKETSGSSDGGSMVWSAQTDLRQSYRYDAASKSWVDLADASLNGGVAGCARIKPHTRTLSAPVTLTLKSQDLSLRAGETTQVSATISGGLTKGHYTLTISSSDSSVASVGTDGVVKGLKAGTVTIVSRIKGTSVTSSLVLTVTPGPTPIPTATPLPTATPVPVVIATATPTPVPEKPGTPTSVKAKTVSYNQIQISWKKAAKADGYNVYRKAGSGKWKLQASVSSSVKKYQDTSAKLGITYQYRVRAWRLVNRNQIYGSYSGTVSGKTALAAVSSLTVSKVSKGIRLKWPKVKGAQGYVIYRKTSGGTYKKVATVKGASKVTYLDQKAPKGVKMVYRIRAYRKVSGKTCYSSYVKSKTIRR